MRSVVMLFNQQAAEKRPCVPRSAGFPSLGQPSVVCRPLFFEIQQTKGNRQQSRFCVSIISLEQGPLAFDSGQQAQQGAQVPVRGTWLYMPRSFSGSRGGLSFVPSG